MPDTITSNWTEVDTMCSDAGDVGGDIQDSESYNRRFVCRPDANIIEFHVLDFNVYWAKEDPETYSNARPDRWIQVQAGYFICTDPEDVGGTEISADYRYWDGDMRQDPDDGPREVCLHLSAEDIAVATEQMG